MCGFSGFINKRGKYNKSESEKIIQNMMDAIIHRGPDDEGFWCDDKKGISLGHRRLSIVDLSSRGHQPMVDHSGRFVIAFNGEIYNHLSLRRDLKKDEINVPWRGHSDTETLLACFDAWGVKNTIQRCTGMFAIALFDIKDSTMYLIRDRIGEKPLYYGMQNGVLLFASELKALKTHPSFQGNIDRNALSLQLKYSYIPTPHSIYKDIKKLEPGTIFKFQLNDSFHINSLQKPESYWSLKNVAEHAKFNQFAGSDLEAINALDKLLLESVKEQMEADVPLGAFLSGGIDSSLITSLMQAQSPKPIKTFSIGFGEEGYNEAKYAKQIANHLGTNHTELYVSPKEALNVIPKLSTLYDEPFSDSSQIPTYLVSQLTQQNVKVGLSGDAGDELFGGYNRYIWTSKVWNKIKYLPRPLKIFVSICMTSLPPSMWDTLLSKAIDISLPGDKIHKLANMLPSNSLEDFYCNTISHWKFQPNIVIGATPSSNLDSNMINCPNFESFEERMMYLDTLNYLPDDILTKVDRASMGVSLEVRVPFLNHNVVEFAYRLPLSMKIRNGESKWILKQLLNKYIPRELSERPKMGFGVPIGEWLRGPLFEWAEELLDESRLKNEGIFYPRQIREKWDEHLSGRRNWQSYLWNILVFQLWFEEQK